MADGAGSAGWLARDSGPLFGLRLSVSARPWRIGPAWAVIGGAVAGGVSIAGGPALLRLVGAIILADAVWGGLWALMAGGSGEAGLADAGWSLPYVQPSAPVVQLNRRLSELSAGAGCRELSAGAALALGLAALLGLFPLLLSGLVFACALLAQVLAARGRRPATCYALLAVGLPWALGVTLAGRQPDQLAGPLALGAAFTMLEWGAQRLRWTLPAGGRGIWIGQLLALAVLAALRLPWAVCLAATLFMPASWWLLRSGAAPAVGSPSADAASRARMIGYAVARSSVWWWLAMLLSAVAARQIVTL